MERSEDYIKRKMNVGNVSTLILALEIIANGNPISVGLDEISELANTALDNFDSGE